MTGWGKRADMLVHEHDPFNAEPAPDVLGRSDVTPINAFYSRNHGPVPDLDPVAWRLEVSGLVERPLDLSLRALREDFEHHSVVATMQCAGNRRAGLIEVRDIDGEDPWRDGAIGTARWSGVRLADVLAAARPRIEASDVAFVAPDVSRLADPAQSYGSSIGLSKALSPETLIAWEMNGDALSRIHGAPARIVVPGYIGARSVKWVQGIHVLDHPSDNYFQATAYRILGAEADSDEAGPGDGISLGPWSLNCAILTPSSDDTVEAGRHTVTGYAVAAEHRSIARVDVSVDDGATWLEARTHDTRGPWTWRRWEIEVDLPEGPTVITARAWDDSGARQPSDPAALWNPKGYANTSWPRVSVHAGARPTPPVPLTGSPRG